MKSNAISSASLQEILDTTWTTQKLCRVAKAGPMTIQVWRRKGLPCVVITGDKRPSIRFIPKEALSWIKQHRKQKQ